MAFCTVRLNRFRARGRFQSANKDWIRAFSIALFRSEFPVDVVLLVLLDSSVYRQGMR